MRPASTLPWVPPALLAAAALLALAAGTASAAEVHVHIISIPTGYDPANPGIDEGDTIVWHNHDAAAQHDSDSDSGGWDTEFLDEGETEATLITKVGTHSYLCNAHTNMKGTVTVRNLLPTITITEGPADGASVSGRLVLRGTATEPVGSVAKVAVSLDGGTEWLDATLEGTTWSFDRGLGDQPHGTQLTILARATDDDGESKQTDPRKVTVNAAPSPSFTISPASPTTRDAVQFTDTTTDPDGDHGLAAWRWRWDFGDGNASSERNPSHRYARKGTYQAVLNVTDDHGAWALSAPRGIQVANGAPVANFSFLPSQPGLGENVTFTSLAEDADGAVAAWTWDFGDNATAAGAEVVHAYDAAGNYTVKLTVRDDEGAVASVAKAIAVQAIVGQRPAVNLTADATQGKAPLRVAFQVRGSDADGTLASWTLDFGDGEKAGPSAGSLLEAGDTVEHTYARGGNFTAVLEATDNDGNAGTATLRIEVEAAQNTPPSARIRASPLSPKKGQAVHFQDDSSDPDPGDRIASREWTFPDGTRATTREVDKAFPRPGTYRVELRVTDLAGASSNATLQLTVQGEAPAVLLDAEPAKGRAPVGVAFTLGARDPDGGVARWTLDFGDGTPPHAREAPPANDTVRHVYDQPGFFTARLVAVDVDGLQAEATLTIEVALPLPEPLPLPPESIGISPADQRLTYRFTAVAGLAGDYTYAWAFGDGGKAEGRQVTYSYLQGGSYEVTLTLVGEDGPVARASTTLAAEDLAGAVAERLQATVGSGVVRLRWTPDPRALGYQVWRAGDDGRFAEIAVVGSSSYSDTEVEDGASYAYTVTFYGAGDGKLQRLSQLGATQAFRRLGEVRATGLVDSDGDGVGDTRDAFPLDATRSEAANSLLLPVAGVAVVAAAAGAGAWRWRSRRDAAQQGPRPLTDLPGLLPEHAAILRGAGVGDTWALAAALPQELGRRTVLPARQLEPWVAAAKLLQLPGMAPAEALALARAGVRDAPDLARAEAAHVAAAARLPQGKVARWARAARRAAEAG